MSQTLPVHRWGHGPIPVTLLHGFTQAAAIWDVVQPHWEDAFSVAAVDLPGHANAPVPHGWVWTDVLGALAAAMPPTSIVVGYSMGARLALALALAHPLWVHALVLESGTPGLENAPARLQRSAADVQLAQSICANGMAWFIQQWENNPTLAGLRNLAPPQRAHLRDVREGNSAEGLAAALEVMGQGQQPNLWPRLADVHLPVLLVTGVNDDTYTRIARCAAQRLRHVQHEVLPCGHAPHLECTERYASTVVRFAKQLWPFPGPSAEET